MIGDDADLIGSGPASWNLPPGESARQAIAPLRGYAYQLQRSLAAWIALGEGDELYLEVAEDYAQIARDPSTFEATLTAVQVKETRESGAVTLNSADVLDAIGRLWALQVANPNRRVSLTFLTTSPVGRERKGVRLPEKVRGLEAWRHAARGADVEPLRAALAARLTEPDLKAFVEGADAEALRERLLKPLTWACGELPIADIAGDNRDALIEIGHRYGATPDLATRAADILLADVLRTIVEGGSRRLRRADFLTRFHAAVSVPVPGQVAMGLAAGALAAGGRAALDLQDGGFWMDPTELGTKPRAPRRAFVAEISTDLRQTGASWLHGGTGLGKSTLAKLVAQAQGGAWRLLDLRGAPAEVAAERLDAARVAVSTMPALVGVIIDDVAADQEGRLEKPLARLQQALRRRDAVCVLTSYAPPGRRLSQAAGLAVGGAIATPSLDDDDALALVAAYGGNGAQWARFVLVAGGFGHPQLVNAVTAGLAARGWPGEEMARWIATGFRSDDVEAEREAARRRIVEELAPNVRGLLRRVARITGAFDRELALAVARAPPPVDDGAESLDRLVGHWIETLPTHRLRNSPLIVGMDRQMLSGDELAALDRVIAQNILARPTCPADLLNTALVHALAAQDGDSLAKLAVGIFTAEGESRTHAASALWVFRDLSRTGPGPLFAGDPHISAMLRLAQHRLLTVRGDVDQITGSVARVLGDVDALVDHELRSHFTGLALSMMLIDDFAFGKIANWLDLVERFEAAIAANPDLADIAGRAAVAAGYDPVSFAFLCHAIRLPDVAALSALFNRLDAMSDAHRERRLAPLKVGEGWMGLMLDSAWLSASEREGFNGREAADIYKRLGELALSWREFDMAARCFRCRAIMLDEYAHDPDGALAALDEADGLVADHLMLRRERAKVHWRRKEYERALELLTALTDRFDAAEPLETAFALREAAVSAGELGRWAEAAQFFRRAGEAARKAPDQPSPMAVGLAADAAVARFAAGERLQGLRDMRLAVEDLERLPPEQSKRAHYCHIATRHLALWLQAQVTQELTVDGEPVRLIPGAASNPDPPDEVLARPVSPIALVWYMLARTALQLGLPAAEVLTWQGVQDARRYGSLEAMILTAIVGGAVRHNATDVFVAHLVPFVEGVRWIATGGLAPATVDVMAPQFVEIPGLSADALRQDPALSTLREAVLAAAFASSLSENPDGLGRLQHLMEAVQASLGFDPLPEIGDAEPRADDDATATAARLVGKLPRSEPLSVDDLFITHLRLWEWARTSHFARSLGPVLAGRVQRDWTNIFGSRSAFLADPLRTIPPIRAALTADGHGLAKVALILGAAQSAVHTRLSPDFRRVLAEAAIGAEPLSE